MKEEQSVLLKDLGKASPGWRLMIGLVLFLFLFLVFWPFFGQLENRSLVWWTWETSTDFHGLLFVLFFPLIFPMMLWWLGHVHRDDPLKPSFWGLGWLTLGMLLFWCAVRLGQPRFGLFAVPFLLVGFLHYGLGGRIARGFAPAAFFLWFLIPVPGLESWLWGHL